MGSTATAEMLRVSGLSISVSTPHGPIDAVHDVGFELHRARTLGLVGESGSGKTLTCRAVLGVLPLGCRVSAGTIELDGEDLTKLDRRGWGAIRGTRIGAVFQDPASYLNPAIGVGEQLAEVLRIRGGHGRRPARDRALELLDLMGLHRPERVYHQVPAELSGGMLQRVMVAIAVCCEPELVIADEATTALDLTTQREVIELLVELRDRLGVAILFVSHDLAAVAELCDDVAVFYAGQVVETGPVAEVIAHPTHPYTEALLRVASLGTDERGGLEVIPGHHPQLGDLAPGCRFAARCDYRLPVCDRAPVELAEPLRGVRTRCVRADDLALEGTAVA